MSHCLTAENVGVVGSSLLIFMFPGKLVLALEAQPRCFSFPLVLKLPEHPGSILTLLWFCQAVGPGS